MFFTWILPCPIILTILFETMHISSGVTNPQNFHPEFSGFDCNGEVAEGTVPHHVTSRQFPEAKLICCYPKSCVGGTIDFCTKNKGTDMCVPCAVDGKCNYREVSSKNLFKRFDHCTDECIRKNAVPDVLFNPTSFTKKAGDDITLLPTIYSDPPQTGFIWRFINETSSSIIADSLRGVITKPEKYGVGTMPNPYLNVTNIDLSNQGTYQLCVVNNIGSSNAINVTLNVTAIPIVSMGNTTDYVDAGKPYSLTCSITGNPTPFKSTYFFKNMRGGEETEIRSDKTPGGVITYNIQNATSSDTGFYTCEAENSEGRGKSTLHLTVEIPPEIYSPYEGLQRRYDVEDKMSMTLWVTTTPIPDVLSCNNLNHSNAMSRSLPFNVTSVGMSYNFSIAKIQPQDEGIYICTAINRLGTTSISFEIDVEFQPKPPVPDGQEMDNCGEGLSIATIVIAGVTIVLSIIILILYYLKIRPFGNDCSDRNRIVFPIIMFGFIMIGIIVVCVVSSLYEEGCNISMEIIFLVVLLFTIAFNIWSLWAGYRRTHQPSDQQHNVTNCDQKSPNDQKQPRYQPLPRNKQQHV